MSGLLAVSGLSFRTGRKTPYGLPEWTAILVEMCAKRTTAESAARNLGASSKMPGGRWFRDAMHTIATLISSCTLEKLSMGELLAQFFMVGGRSRNVCDRSRYAPQLKDRQECHGTGTARGATAVCVARRAPF